jgi:hypothetical protein
VVERTFAWFTRWRRLVRDYEQRLDVSAPWEASCSAESPIETILKRTLSAFVYRRIAGVASALFGPAVGSFYRPLLTISFNGMKGASL